MVVEPVKKKKLCIVVDYFPICNGAYFQGMLLARELQSLGADVIFVSYLTKGRKGSLCTFGTNEKDVGNFDVYSLDPNVSSGFKAVGFYMRLFFNLRDRYDQVLIQGLPAGIFWMLPVWKLLGKKIFIRLTGLNINDPVEISRSNWGFIKILTLQLADKHINPSSAMERVYKHSSMIPSKSVKIPNGVDTERFRQCTKKTKLRQQLGYSPEDRIVLYVGTIRRAKGIDLLLDAWDRVLAEVPQALLVMIGPFCPVCPGVRVADKEFIEQIRPKIGFFVEGNNIHLLQNRKNRIQLLGVVDRVERYYQIAEVFAFPSRREGMPNVVMEAMASGVPVVANDIEEVTGDLIQNEREGTVVPNEDAQSFAEAIIKLLNHPKKRQQIAITARKKMEDNFSSKQFVKRYLDILN
jgi:glycosyltransferase involved in cell wall biosynthesis